VIKVSKFDVVMIGFLTIFAPFITCLIVWQECSVCDAIYLGFIYSFMWLFYFCMFVYPLFKEIELLKKELEKFMKK